MTSVLFFAAALKVLTIGNSFSVQMTTSLPPVAKDLGCELDIASLYIGGCSLERHWNNVTNASDCSYLLAWNRGGVAKAAWPELAACLRDTQRLDRKTKKMRPGKGANVADVLKAVAWDVVTIQQASHFSWQPATYHPWGDNLVATIRARAPKAEIVVQETWSYTPFDKRLKNWKIDANEMYAKLHAAYGDFAKHYGFRVIPTGTAVQNWRKALPVAYTEHSLGGDVVGTAVFSQNANGQWKPQGDVFHMAPTGNYLQALVWAETLFTVDVTRCQYAPKGAGFEPERVTLLRKVAHDTVRNTKK